MLTREEVVESLKKVNDPELGIDIWTLGLIYDIFIEETKIKVRMTLTSPMCPFGPQLISDVKYEVGRLKGIKEVDVELTFEPVWEPTEEVKLMLGVM